MLTEEQDVRAWVRDEVGKISTVPTHWDTENVQAVVIGLGVFMLFLLILTVPIYNYYKVNPPPPMIICETACGGKGMSKWVQAHRDLKDKDAYIPESCECKP